MNEPRNNTGEATVGPVEERRSIWRSPFLWAALAGLVLIPAIRPWMRFEPDPPPKLFDLPEYRLIGSDGQPFGSDDLAGQVYVANFFFTRCVSICPRLTAAMKRLDRRFEEAGEDRVHLVSISVDPDYDTPVRLADYGESFGIDPGRWTLLTGTGSEVRELVVEGFRTGMGNPVPLGQPPGQPPLEDLIDIAHTGRFVLVDGEGAIRGYYEHDEEGLDEIFHRSRHVLESAAKR
jgi:protein SCO1/2